jgi:hypothetical protein
VCESGENFRLPTGKDERHPMIVRPDGRERVVHAIACPVGDNSAAPDSMVCLIRDVTERVRSFERLFAEARALLQGNYLFESIAAITVFDEKAVREQVARRILRTAKRLTVLRRLACTIERIPAPIGRNTADPIRSGRLPVMAHPISPISPRPADPELRFDLY